MDVGLDVFLCYKQDMGWDQSMSNKPITNVVRTGYPILRGKNGIVVIFGTELKVQPTTGQGNLKADKDYKLRSDKALTVESC